ncbi:MAG: hypothetical protein RL757_507 [Bacteroidota bacterium]|jgi:hypothetical protein
MFSKKNLLLSVFCSISSILLAQISLVVGDAPQIGDYYLSVGVDSTVGANLDIGQAGANRTWNFGYLTPARGLKPDTFDFRALSVNQSLVDTFRSAANVAQYSRAGTTNYYKVANNRYNFVGSSTPAKRDESGPLVIISGGYIKTSNELTEMVYPFTFGSMFRDTGVWRQFAVASLVPPQYVLLDSMVVVLNGRTADAWGRITTPLGTFDALRVRRDAISQTNTFGAIEVTATEWWVKEYPNPILTKTTISYQQVNFRQTSVSYIAGRTVGTESIRNSPLRTANLYPNPARQKATIDFSLEKPQSIRWQLCNALGQTVWTKAASSFSEGAHQQEIPLDQIGNGIYWLHMWNESGEKIGVSKLIVQQ